MTRRDDPRGLVLASTSVYRAALLARLRVPFEQVDPGIEEDVRPCEDVLTRAQRLAAGKAQAVAHRFPGRVVVGSDQTAAIGSALLHKPGGLTVARQQLAQCSGRTVLFHTAVCVIGARASGPQLATASTAVRFRALDEDTIERYLALEQPFDCAGSFRCEGLGITLFESLTSNDPTALEGLPLIALGRLLRGAGVELPPAVGDAVVTRRP